MESLNLLFVCSRNQWRSPTAEKVWSKVSGIQTRSAGTSPNAKRTVSLADLKWADHIFVMESKHRDRIKAKFGRTYWGAPIHVLGIPDDYTYMDPELQEMVLEMVEPLLETS